MLSHHWQSIVIYYSSLVQNRNWNPPVLQDYISSHYNPEAFHFFTLREHNSALIELSHAEGVDEIAEFFSFHSLEVRRPLQHFRESRFPSARLTQSISL